MDSPTSGVLDTYELLENILLRVPMKQLFVVQRVSKTWKDIIERSQSLRKKMFLLADGEPLRPRTVLHVVDVLEFNPELRLNPALYTSCNANIHDEEKDERDTIAPAEFCLFRDSRASHLTVYLDVCDLSGSFCNPLPSGLWKSMLLSQPPMQALTYQAEPKRRDIPKTEIECTLYRPSGITLGELYALNRRLHKEYLDRTGEKFADSWYEFSLSPMQEGAGEAGTLHTGGSTSNSAEDECVCSLLPILSRE